MDMRTSSAQKWDYMKPSLQKMAKCTGRIKSNASKRVNFTSWR